jgi:hypothetical protein
LDLGLMEFGLDRVHVAPCLHKEQLEHVHRGRREQVLGRVRARRQRTEVEVEGAARGLRAQAWRLRIALSDAMELLQRGLDAEPERVRRVRLGRHPLHV